MAALQGDRGTYGGTTGTGSSRRARGAGLALERKEEVGWVCPRNGVGSIPEIRWDLSLWEQRWGHPNLTFSPLGPAGPGGPMGPVRPCWGQRGQ